MEKTWHYILWNSSSFSYPVYTAFHNDRYLDLRRHAYTAAHFQVSTVDLGGGEACWMSTWGPNLWNQSPMYQTIPCLPYILYKVSTVKRGPEVVGGHKIVFQAASQTLPWWVFHSLESVHGLAGSQPDLSAKLEQTRMSAVRLHPQEHKTLQPDDIKRQYVNSQWGYWCQSWVKSMRTAAT